MTLQIISYRVLTAAIAGVWVVNGLFCKVVGLVPRHEAIVARILGTTHAHLLTQLIGIAEVGIAIWIISGYRRKGCAILQMIAVFAMNVIEFVTVPDLLLFGRFNIVIAFVFIFIVYLHAFHFDRRSHVEFTT